MKAQHTPGNWWAGKHRNSDNIVDQIIISDNETNYRIAGLNVSNHGRSEEEQTANAAFIVRACNAHDELVTALQAISNWDLHSICADGTKAKNAGESLANVRRFAREIIAKAEGKGAIYLKLCQEVVKAIITITGATATLIWYALIMSV